MLPCPTCSEHYKEHINKFPPDCTSREKLSKWLVEIHNIVNEKNGKPRVEYDMARRHYLENTCELSYTSRYTRELENKVKVNKQLNTALIVAVVFLLTICVVASFKRRR